MSGRYALELDSGAVVPLPAYHAATPRRAKSYFRQWNKRHEAGVAERARSGPYDTPVVFPRRAVRLLTEIDLRRIEEEKSAALRERFRPKRKEKEGRPAVLYRHFAANGSLLYVGVSLSIAQRIMGHRNSSCWWCDVARIDLEHYPSRAEALEAEREAIFKESPMFNRQHANTDALVRLHLHEGGSL